ncbi:FXYD domain-containing ion transport regulator 5 isoform X2 [Mustela lutreola]|uniref:FXYD domain-containing ion transport regulator n=1 Tax=Mustela putorius furo TaxID=9669 RepID=A0A8U0TH42_MUSPF|nr:FXYD domain-containing ion transport regulator 5 isoform X2 [Mustela putorius furo]XP_059007936.1 FXYD domain-containing ion transport regulator 5 isoform X2 [Mustela lutreola]
MTEPVSVPARQLSPGHTLRRDAATAAALCPRGCRLGTPGSDMSPSGRLCLLTIVGLILPTRGQISKEATVFSPADPNQSNVRALTPAPDADPEPKPTPQISLQTGGTTREQEEEIQTPKMESQQPTGVYPPLTTDPRTGKTGPEGSSEDNPFSYDEYTLRKRGLLVAAVLFITGIVILTSGKCRRLPQLCRNRNR